MSFAAIALSVVTLIADVVCIVRIRKWWKEGQAYYQAGQTFHSMAERLLLDVERSRR